MKKSRRIFSFALALVFCFTAMNTIVWAAYPNCTHSSRYHSYVPMGGVSSHYIDCELCGGYIDDEPCTEVFPGFDCTADTYCMFCDRTLSHGQNGHTPSGTWYMINSVYHGSECMSMMSSGTKCTEKAVQPHTYNVGDNVCNECGYVSQ